MRIIKAFFSILLTLVIIVGLFLGIHFFLNYNTESVSIEEAREIASKDEILSNQLSGFSQLSEEEQAAYLTLTSALEQLNTSVSLSEFNITEKEIEEIYKAILRDHPEYFFLGNIEYLKNLDETINTVNLNYTGDPETIAIQKEEVESWKNQILSGITEEMSNYDIALFLHDQLVSNTDYNQNAANNQNLLSVVEEQSSVCAGYTRAYQYLLNEAGIFSTYVSGNTLVGPHAWNLLEIDGIPFYVDVTWDDPNFVSNGGPSNYISHVYFGGATSDFESTHTLDLEYYSLPVIPDSDFNYYISQGLSFDLETTGDYNKIVQLIREAQAEGKTYLEIKLKNKNQISKLLNEISYEPFLFNSSISYIEDSNYPVITFIFNT